MKKGDFSKITNILKTNGVSFLECFFRSSLYEDDLNYEPTKKWRLDFSNGTNYLGSLDTTNDEFDSVLMDGKLLKSCRLYLGKIKGLPGGEVCIDLYFTATQIQGRCTITLETTKL